MATKDFVFLEGYAFGKGYHYLTKALNASNKLHGSQMRKDGSPYITHPTAVTATAVRFGIEDEKILCAMQLHDVIEDCDIDMPTLSNKYGIPVEVCTAVHYVSKYEEYPISMESYMHNILNNKICALVKIGDRAHNISTMANGFSIAKQKEYIEETEKYIIPLCKEARRMYPEYSGYIVEMKKQIYNICDITKAFIKMLEENEKNS